MILPSLLAFAALAQATPQRGGGSRSGVSMLRFGCSQVVIERLDPLVNPGANPSPHHHQIVGGNAFNASIPYTDVAQIASCTTCHFDQDFSNYWTANLYFRARNGSYKRVPQIANQGNTGDLGGLTVYYTSPGPKKTTAFKPGFRMLTGDATRRKPFGLGKETQSCYRCYTAKNFAGSRFSPCFDPTLDTESLPATPCPGGIRSNIIYPMCWDGKNLDSPNHADHVAHPADGPVSFSIVTKTCPATHPVKIPQIMLEVMWDTSAYGGFFNDKANWPEDGSQPLVLSTGDKKGGTPAGGHWTGYGQHADYVFGWKGDSLQQAMDSQNCYLTNCNVLSAQTPAVKNKCAVPDTVREETEGWLAELPGGGSGA